MTRELTAEAEPVTVLRNLTSEVFALGNRYKKILKIFGVIDAVTSATAKQRIHHSAALVRLGVLDK